MADSIVVQAMRQFKRQLLGREANTLQEMARRWLGVERALTDSMELLARQLAEDAAAGRTPTVEQVRRMERYQRLIQQLLGELSFYTEQIEPLLIAEQRTLAGLGIQHADRAIRLSLPQGMSALFDVLPTDATAFMAGLAGDGSPLRALLADAWPDAVDHMTRELVTGTALGINPQQVARNMAKGTTASLNRMMTVARSEGLRVYRESSRAQYQASGIVPGFRRIATHDTRVCAACLMAEGELYQVTESLREHPNGRCSLIPIIDGVPETEWEKGPDWFVRQPAPTQQAILGPGRFRGWQDGQFDLDQLVTVRRNDTWGDSVQPTPLKELV